MFDPPVLSNIIDPHQSNSSYTYLNFPSHLLHDDELLLSTVLPYSSPLTPMMIPPPPPPPPPPPSPPKAKRKRVARMAVSGGDCGGEKTKRRRGKTDRHSKINTAKGPRDRRMRLSLQIARKFFDLQDMLGFDKASKTIEWLFNKSKAAIKDLADRSCTSSAMAAAAPSPDDHQDMVNDPGQGGEGEEDDVVRVKEKNSKNNKGMKKGALLFQAMRENREKARARARERTKEKLLLMQQKQGDEQNPSSLEKSRHGMDDDYYDDEDEDHDDQGQQLSLEDQMASVGIIDKYSNIFDFDHLGHHDQYHQNMISRVPGSSSDPIMASSNEISFSGFPTNWDVTQSMSMSMSMNMGANHTEIIQNPNCGFLGRPYNNHGN